MSARERPRSVDEAPGSQNRQRKDKSTRSSSEGQSGRRRTADVLERQTPARVIDRGLERTSSRAGAPSDHELLVIGEGPSMV
jgi:hypothetical protein